MMQNVLTGRGHVLSVVARKAEDLRDDEAVLVLDARRVVLDGRRLRPRGFQE